MATRQRTLDFLLDQLAGAGGVTAKKMFGEYGIFLSGRMIAILGEDRLYVKPTAPGRALLREPVEAEPYPGAKPCFLIEADLWEDSEWLVELAVATANALPLPAPRKKKGS